YGHACLRQLRAYHVADVDRALDRVVIGQPGEVPLLLLSDAERSMDFSVRHRRLARRGYAITVATDARACDQAGDLALAHRVLARVERALDRTGHAGERHADGAGVAIEAVCRIAVLQRDAVLGDGRIALVPLAVAVDDEVVRLQVDGAGGVGPSRPVPDDA